MGDQLNVEEIMAEEEEVSVFQKVLSLVTGFVGAYGWFILAGGIALYFLWENHGHKFRQQSTGAQKQPVTQREQAEFLSKEEARQRYIAKMQEQYEKEAAARAEKVKQMEEEKRKAKLAELEKLRGISGGQKLGDIDSSSGQPGSKASKTKPKPGSNSSRPEYNPLMGDTETSRACFRRPGRSGG